MSYIVIYIVNYCLLHVAFVAMFNQTRNRMSLYHVFAVYKMFSLCWRAPDCQITFHQARFLDREFISDCAFSWSLIA